MATQKEIKLKLIEIIKVILNPESVAKINFERPVNLQTDLNIDSLTFVSLIVLVEMDFGVKLSDDQEFLTSVVTLDDVAQYITNKQ